MQGKRIVLGAETESARETGRLTGGEHGASLLAVVIVIVSALGACGAPSPPDIVAATPPPSSSLPPSEDDTVPTTVGPPAQASQANKEPPGQRNAPANTASLAPRTECAPDGECSVSLELVDGAKTLRSPPLPFTALSGEISPMGAGAALALGDTTGRELDAWSIGREENSIALAVERMSLADGAALLVVHQTGGYEHVKRAHVVLQLQDDQLLERLRFVEGAGPELINVRPDGQDLLVELGTPGAMSTTRYVWSESAHTFINNE